MLTETLVDHRSEDVGNLMSLEHVNIGVPDQATATVFYLLGLGLTRDPYMTVGLNNMWINVGSQQFHLPTRSPQVVPGEICVVMPDLPALEQRLESVGEPLSGTRFGFERADGGLLVTCPWGNRFRCTPPAAGPGEMQLGVPYVEFRVAPETAQGIGRFYQQVMGAPVSLERDAAGAASALVYVGSNQRLVFRESPGPLPAYDGHHVAVYLANFSGPYGFLKERGLVTEEIRNHQFRFQSIVDPESGAPMCTLEHEVRSLRHPMYRRRLVNRMLDQDGASR